MNILGKLFLSRKRIALSDSAQTERCVCCGAPTDIPRTLPIEQRTHYISGCGQLCPACYSKIYSNFSNADMLQDKLSAALLLSQTRKRNK